MQEDVNLSATGFFTCQHVGAEAIARSSSLLFVARSRELQGMARRASGSNVSYKDLDSDGDDGMAPWGLSDGDDDADLKALKAAAPLAKKRKKAGTKSVGDTYGARESGGLVSSTAAICR